MFSLEAGTVALVAITFGAAFVNGALGYGFSSLTVPVAILLDLYLLYVYFNVYLRSNRPAAG